ncbi:MAG: aminodeoxychorismate/anthranilate synthase component II [Bacteroidales bacterium]|nr:aminodeoxychorismate/anthranilate synthase component II [Bacteroidales bacterium]MCF8332989.1 aminodeoxychorismate/anthranilate synthase component II [Bacteroidales bacterium]
MQKVLLIDNYDSFTYNLVELLKQAGCEVTVMKNDRVEEEKLRSFDKIILSPGPGLPSDAAQMVSIIKKYYREKCFLGVCLGHQGIAEAFGAKLKRMAAVMHGEKTTARVVEKDTLFGELPRSFEIGHYHSWTVSDENLPDELLVTMRDENDEIMALKHRRYHLWGVQFHPESIMTPTGKQIIRNFLSF